jgi:formylglycine-generating enzyme required for sulfatase activity
LLAKGRILTMNRLLALAALLFAFPAHAEVTFNWVTIGDPGNAADDTTYGAVPYTYRISKYEVTNAQYAEFLNAVAKTDTNALYDTGMGSGSGGITRSGSSGSYTYSAIAGRENKPVNFVAFWDATRFANWLHNGQPTGLQDSTTTEDGAYTITQTGIDNNTITRNAGAAVFVTSEDEWYKAAYFAAATSYFDYPATSSTPTACTVPGATANTANCSSAVGDLTNVGSYTNAASPSGTFDQGGNVREWNEAVVTSISRGLRGGNFGNGSLYLAAALRGDGDPDIEFSIVGFRVASPVPPPPVPSLGPIGLLLVAAGLLGFAAYRRGRA